MPDRLTPEELQEIEARFKALPDCESWSIDSLQWTNSVGDEQLDYYRRDANGNRVFVPAFTVIGVDTVGDSECSAMEKPMAEWIFHSRTDIPALLAEIEVLRTAMGAAAKAVAQDDSTEAYHQLYMALVGDLSLPAEEHSRIMREAMGVECPKD